MTIRDTIRDAHNRIAPGYGLTKPGQGGTVFPSYDDWNFRHSVLTPVETILREHDLAGPGRLLDAGCGNGQFLSVYAKFTQKRLTGIDFSPVMLNAAAVRAEADGCRDRVTLAQGDLENLAGWRDQTFCVTHCFGVVEHLDDPAKVLRELARVTKAGGTLIFGYPRRWSLSTLSYFLCGQSPEHWGRTFTPLHQINLWSKWKYYRFFDREQIWSWLEEAGFRPMASYPVAPLHMIGAMGYPLRKIASRAESGYTLLNSLESRLLAAGLPPAGEYVVSERRPL